jgi:CRP-like cAMP-binding protein
MPNVLFYRQMSVYNWLNLQWSRRIRCQQSVFCEDIMEITGRRKFGTLSSRIYSHARLSRLVRDRNPVSYECGSLVHTEKSSVADVLYVDAGMVKLSMRCADGSRFTVHLVGPGEAFACAAPGEDVQRFEVYAFTKCSIVSVPREEIQNSLGGEHAPVLAAALEKMDALWFSIFADFVAFLGMTYRERLLTVIGDLAARLGTSDSRGILILPELSERDLAELIGSSAMLARKLLFDMAEQGIIARDGKRYILTKGRTESPE